VQGDTNSVLAGALAASKVNISISHHEAGLRSHDLNMLEETNRIITDHISDLLFAPTKDARNNLLEEGIPEHLIHLTGNTIVDAVKQNIEISNKKSNIIEKLSLERKNYILATAHRAENVDKKERLSGILKGLDLVRNSIGKEIIYPMHPRTKKRIKEFNLSVPDGIKVCEPLGFLDFLQLESNASLILTDSGGLQEEASILNIPCVTLRNNTERPETVEYGVNVLSGTNPRKILKDAKKMINKNKEYKNLFGDGLASKRIVEIISSKIQ
jgi:UDP-N-acetylglucosamine 2-epimerase (non-hydrolysing)